MNHTNLSATQIQTQMITLTLSNTYNLTSSCIGQPIIYNNIAIGNISDINSTNVVCNIYPRFITYYPEYLTQYTTQNITQNTTSTSSISGIYLNINLSSFNY